MCFITLQKVECIFLATLLQDEDKQKIREQKKKQWAAQWKVLDNSVLLQLTFGRSLSGIASLVIQNQHINANVKTGWNT